MTRWISILALAAAASLAGCGGDSKTITAPIDPVGSEAAVNAGLQALAAGDFAGAHAQFAAAVSLDPSNPRAQLGLAITDVYRLESDPQVVDILDRVFGPGGPTPTAKGPELARLGRPLTAADLLMGAGLSSRRKYDAVTVGSAVFRLLMVAADEPPAVSEVQQVLKNLVLPRLASAESRLAVAEAHAGFEWRIPPAVTGEPDTIEIDHGEVFMLDALVNQLQGMIGMAVAYNFDAPYETARAESLLAPGTAWGTLHPDGATQLATARQNLLVANDRVHSAITSIQAETDDQSDDVIPAAALTDPDFLEFLNGFDQAHAALQGPLVVTVNDWQGSPFDIAVALGPFFTNPIQDLKTKLPAHTFDPGTGDPIVTNPITFPDPVFNGIFPGMTNALWQQLIGAVGP